MHTLVLQSIAALLSLFLGVVCMAAARRPMPEGDPHAAAWRLSAAAFLLHGVHVTAQASAAAWAYASGPGTPVYETYLRWMPSANYSRSVLMLTFAVLLTTLVLLPAHRRGMMRWAPLALGVAAVVGGVAGSFGEAFTERVHYARVSLLDLTELMLLLVALYAGILREAISHTLWLALVVIAFYLALTVLWTAALTGLGVGWAPAPWQMAAYRCLLLSGAIWLIVRDLRGRPAVAAPRPAPAMPRMFPE